MTRIPLSRKHVFLITNILARWYNYIFESEVNFEFLEVDMGKSRGVALLIIVVGVIANNVIYLQDLWFGQSAMTLDSWRAYLAIFVSLAIIAVGLIWVIRADGAGSGD